jgi:neurofibromin 1
MAHSILLFLDASPLTIFKGTSAGEAPAEGDDGPNKFFDDIFNALLEYLVTDDEKVRYLTNSVVQKITITGTVAFWNRSQSEHLHRFILNFWRSRSVQKQLI